MTTENKCCEKCQDSIYFQHCFDKNCPCHTQKEELFTDQEGNRKNLAEILLSLTPTQKWEENIKKLANNYANKSYLVSEESHPEQEEKVALKELIDAISQLLTSQRQELKEEILGEIEKRNNIILTEPCDISCGYAMAEKSGGIKALEDIKNIVKDK